MKKSKTEKLVRRIVKDEQKRNMYSTAELAYMELQLKLMKIARKKKQLITRATKGFTPTCKESGNQNHKQWNKSQKDSDKPTEAS
ncbi:hypothetical protein SCRM01_081c [Synechococcus phage S-CRM01]|uniref:hypothetical protein n=1 Tax=Synechococcus phage S-CRM01 TaxID=1026955 RepID=UPI000209E38D|nr:hypothetical protein SCRM01_081c [Synechococcus phage S-CRM01]AEC53027.1 hypothetical protein SCRM01_081c [Synechococcus phage S-CRM01]